jgi:hypothetical protein
MDTYTKNGTGMNAADYPLYHTSGEIPFPDSLVTGASKKDLKS